VVARRPPGWHPRRGRAHLQPGDGACASRPTGRRLLRARGGLRLSGSGQPAPGVETMKMQISEDDGVVKVGLVGRLDTPGVDATETRLTAAVVPRAARAIVDLSGVEFIGSLGLRMFITIARALSRKSGKMVLYAPQGFVAQVFETAALDDIIPVPPDPRTAPA